MSDQPAAPEIEAPATPETPEVPTAPPATPGEIMIPKARLDEEIGKRKDLEKQIKDLAKQQAEGSEAKKQLDEMASQLQQMEKRSAFLEEASKPETQCRNIKAAWLLAEAGDLFDKRGTPDWTAIKAAAPELFGAPSANANAGRNTQAPPAPNQSMNAFIRKAAGRE